MAMPAGRAEIEHRRVAQVLERRIAERRQKQVLHQLVAQLAPAAVPHHDGGIIGERQRAGPVGEVGDRFLLRCVM